MPGFPNASKMRLVARRATVAFVATVCAAGAVNGLKLKMCSSVGTPSSPKLFPVCESSTFGGCNEGVHKVLKYWHSAPVTKATFVDFGQCQTYSEQYKLDSLSKELKKIAHGFHFQKKEDDAGTTGYGVVQELYNEIEDLSSDISSEPFGPYRTTLTLKMNRLMLSLSYVVLSAYFFRALSDDVYETCHESDEGHRVATSVVFRNLFQKPTTVIPEAAHFDEPLLAFQRFLGPNETAWTLLKKYGLVSEQKDHVAIVVAVPQGNQSALAEILKPGAIFPNLKCPDSGLPLKLQGVISLGGSVTFNHQLNMPWVIDELAEFDASTKPKPAPLPAPTVVQPADNRRPTGKKGASPEQKALKNTVKNAEKEASKLLLDLKDDDVKTQLESELCELQAKKDVLEKEIMGIDLPEVEKKVTDFVASCKVFMEKCANPPTNEAQPGADTLRLSRRVTG